MLLSSLINAKINLIAGMAIGIGMAIICKETCKRKGQLANKTSTTKAETSE